MARKRDPRRVSEAKLWGAYCRSRDLTGRDAPKRDQDDAAAVIVQVEAELRSLGGDPAEVLDKVNRMFGERADT